MEDASANNLTIKEMVPENDDEDSLVINTATDMQKRQPGPKV